jgi:poly(glycerol-phosphate) alpha-glucosyltransferase
VPLPVHDYQRADGSTYLRMKEFDHIDRSTWPRSIQRVARDGTVIEKFGSVAQLYKRFVRDLAGEERTFLFVDSRFMLQHLAPVRAPYVHLVYVLHNIHLLPPRLWSSPLGGIYDRVLDRASDVDAFVTLTGRQRDDIAQRRGSTSNLFVVPNPVDLPEPPAPLPPRDPLRLAVVARIEKQKRVAHAVAAFARVLEKVPDAHLDVYGSGRQSGTVAAAVAKHGVSTSVTLHGFDPHATDSLWSASGFVMTSMFEGYPLSTLESLSRGCPVVSYDIKYGPREQITDGVEGFLVDDGDIEALAERLVRLLTSPQLVARMSEAARRKAAEHDHRHFLEDWGCVLDRIVELKPGRTRLEEVGLEVTRLQLGRTGRWRPSFVPGRIGRRGRLRFEGRLRVSGRSATSDLSSAVVSLAAVHPPSGRCTDLPLSVRRRDDVFELAGSTRLAALFGGADRLDEVRLRLRVVWENSAWETLVGRPDRTKTGVEATYDPQGAMALSVR